MKKYISSPLFGLFFVISSFGIAQSALSGNASFQLRNYQTGLCLGIAGGNPNRGTALVTWTCDYSPNQSWTQLNSAGVNVNPYFISGQGFYMTWGLPNTSAGEYGNSGGLVVGVSGAVIKNGTRLIDWTQTDEANQQWTSVFIGYNFDSKACYIFENGASPPYGQPYVMSVLGGNPNPGGQVAIWQLFVDVYRNPDFLGHPDQYWCVY